MSEQELVFISGEFMTSDLPKEMQYLWKYFWTSHQQAFLRYYLAFGKYHRFTEHTGIPVDQKYLTMLKARLLKLQAAHQKAKTEMDLETLADIESGKYKTP